MQPDKIENITKKVLGKKYLINNEFEIFKGFKDAIEDYEYAYKSYKDILDEQRALSKSSNYKKNNDNIENNLNVGYNIILRNIFDEKIKPDKKDILEGIINANKFLKNKPYYSLVGDTDIIKIYIYDKALAKFIDYIKKK